MVKAQISHHSCVYCIINFTFLVWKRKTSGFEQNGTYHYPIIPILATDRQVFYLLCCQQLITTTTNCHQRSISRVVFHLLPWILAVLK
jgi:hypothetical protein